VDATFGYLFRKLPLILCIKFLLYSIGSAITTAFFTENLGSNTVDLDDVFGKYPVWLVLFLGCVLAPLAEEIVFRFIPFGVLKVIHDRTGLLDHLYGTLILLLVLLGTSFTFGFYHGGIGNVFLQGVGGLVSGVVFIHWGVYNGHPGRGLAASTIVHGSWNLLIMGLFLLTSR